MALATSEISPVLAAVWWPFPRLRDLLAPSLGPVPAPSRGLRRSHRCSPTERGRGHGLALPRGTRRIQRTLGTCRRVGFTGDHLLRVRPSPFPPGHVTPPRTPAGWVPVLSPVPGLLFPLCAGDLESPERRGDGPRGGRLNCCGCPCPRGRLGWALSPLELRTPAGPLADPGGEDLEDVRQ